MFERFLAVHKPTTSVLDSRVSGPTPSGMGPLHENDVFRVALLVWHENRIKCRVFGRPRRRLSKTITRTVSCRSKRNPAHSVIPAQAGIQYANRSDF